MIEAYLESLLDVVTAPPIVRASNVTLDKRTLHAGLIRGDLLTLPRDLVDYVICHDLVHLRIPNHGQGFRALMGCHLPDWQERQRRLARWVVAGGQETDTGERFHTT